MMKLASGAMMRIEIEKRPDGSGVLRCIRADGSITWQKQKNYSAYFALHDVTHFAVETTLGYRRGFFGLLAEGWDMADIGGKGARGKLPDEAIEVERIVGLFDRERASKAIWSAEEFNAFAPRILSEDEIASVRSTRTELIRRWSRVLPGGKLELKFGPDGHPALAGSGGEVLKSRSKRAT